MPGIVGIAEDPAGRGPHGRVVRGERALHAIAVVVGVATERDLHLRVAAPVDQLDLRVPLLDAAGLPHAAPVEADEVRALAHEVEERDLPAADEPRQAVRDLVEDRPHDSPPKTSTSRNRQAGEACPTRMIWFGSPLPQNGVPSTSTVLASPTASRLRQKVAEIPR